MAMQFRIDVSAVSPPDGTVAIGDGRPEAFHGWLQLLAILEAALATSSDVAPGDLGGDLPAGHAAELGQDVGHVGLDGAS